MVDDVKDITETAESKANEEALDRARLARERREAEQRKRLDELRAHAAAAQAQREKRDEERRRRQAEQRAKDDDRRIQVEERKRAIWEASISRREALLQRERDRTERLERARAARSAPRPAFAFGSSTPRLLEPLDSAGFFWAARSTNPIDQMNFFESLAASTTNVMYASTPLTRRASALQLDTSDTDTKDEPDRQPAPVVWSSVARRRTDLVPTAPAPRAPGRAYSMTRLDRLPAQRPLPASPSMHHLNRTQTRSGDTTPGSRPGSALSNATGVVRRPASAPRKPRPASIAGTGVNTPRGGVGEAVGASAATTPSVSRDSTVVGAAGVAAGGATGEVPRRAASAPRRPRPASLHVSSKPVLTLTPGDGKPPLHRKPKLSKEHDKTPRGKSSSVSPGRALSPSPPVSKGSSVDKEISHKAAPPAAPSSIDKSQVSAAEVTQKLEALQIHNGPENTQHIHDKIIETQESVEIIQESKTEQASEEVKSIETQEQTLEVQKPIEAEKPTDVQKPVDKIEEIKEETREEKREEKKEPSQEKTDDSEMTASMSGRRIATEEQAKAALAERRRRAREELERQAELERQRLQREAEEEAERQRVEEERQRREEQEARELARLQRELDEEKLRKAIEAQQALERAEAERRVREEEERRARVREEEEKRRAAELAERARRAEADREERERLARKQRVEAIMARTRLRKAEEDKKQQENKQGEPPSAPATAPESAPAPASDSTPAPAPAPAPVDNGNAVATGDLLGFTTSQAEESKAPEASEPPPAVEPASEPTEEPSPAPRPNNGNVTADLLGLSEHNNYEDKIEEQTTTKQIQQPTIDNAPIANTPTSETNNGNVQLVPEPPAANVSHTPANNDHTPANNDHMSSNNDHMSANNDHMSANISHMSANFIQNEITSNENQTKMADVPKLLDDDFTTHNGHGAAHNHPLTLQNAI